MNEGLFTEIILLRCLLVHNSALRLCSKFSLIRLDCISRGSIRTHPCVTNVVRNALYSSALFLHEVRCAQRLLRSVVFGRTTVFRVTVSPLSVFRVNLTLLADACFRL